MHIIEKTAYNTLILVTPYFMKNVWADNTLDVTEEDIKAMMTSTANSIKQYKPKYFMGNDSNRQFVYTVDMQSWIATTLAMACAEAGVLKFAVIDPKNFIVELSTEQTIEEAGKLPFELQRFANEADALQWLGV